MDVLDLRSDKVRSLERNWRRWADDAPYWLRALEPATRALTRRVVAWRCAGRGRPPATPRIVSVGNLKVGGTGKTPVVVGLARDLAARGIGGVVLTRGYGSVAAGPLTVVPEDRRAGDEARLMAAALAACDWTVVQARNRRRGLKHLLAARPDTQVVLLEDGHQTAGVPRHLDCLIIDRWHIQESATGVWLRPETGHLLPWGPYRESAAGAERAAIWLVETEQALPAGIRGSLETGRGGSATGVAQVVAFRRRASLAPELARHRRAADQGYATIAGIAHPERFEATCTSLLGKRASLAVRLDDHVRYDAALAERLRAVAADKGIHCWLTTEKDWIKLRDLGGPTDAPNNAPNEAPLTVPVLPVRLEIIWPNGKTLPELVEERLVSGRESV